MAAFRDLIFHAKMQEGYSPVLHGGTGTHILIQMMRVAETIWLAVFLLGLLVTGMFGTWSETAPFWYGAGLISVAGMGALLSRQTRCAESISWTGIVFMLLLAIYAWWRGLTSEVAWLARQDLAFSGAAMITYGLVATRFTGARCRLAILGVLFLLVAGNTGLGLYQYFTNPRLSIFTLFGLRRGAEISAGGFFESGNHLAGFLTLAGMPLLGVAVLGQGLRMTTRTLTFIGFLLAATGVAFSTSRGGVLGFLTGMGLLIGITTILLLYRKRLKKGSGRSAGAWLIFLAFLFLVMIGSAGIVLRKFFGSTEALKTLNGRAPLWDAALEQWQISPLTGTGARSYEYMERGFRTLDTRWATYSGEMDAQFAHNDYLQCLGDYGLMGLILILLGTGVHTLLAMRAGLGAVALNRNPDTDGLATGLVVGSIAGIAGGMVQALAEFNLHIGINVVMTGLLLGWLATPGFRREMPAIPSENAPHPKAGSSICARRFAMSGIIAAISCIFLSTAWRLAPADLAWQKSQRNLYSATTMAELISTSGELQTVTTLDPANPKAWEARGKVTVEIASRTNEKYAVSFYQAALTHLKQSLALYPKNPYAASQAGSVAGFLGKLDDADKFFSTAMRWGNNIQSVNALYGDYLVRRKDYYKAIGFLKIATWLSQDPDVQHNLGTKMLLCLRRLKEQGIAPPPETFFKPGTLP